jgi:hypothetical protein
MFGAGFISGWATRNWLGTTEQCDTRILRSLWADIYSVARPQILY